MVNTLAYYSTVLSPQLHRLYCAMCLSSSG